MYFKQITVPGLGCNSYVIGCPGARQAVVVDPKRDVQDYMDISRDEGMKITHGATLLERCPLEQTLNPDQFEKILRQGASVIDTRDTGAFGGFHIPGAINIGFEKQMANWIGMVEP
jgi:hypothetical protein